MHLNLAEKKKMTLSKGERYIIISRDFGDTNSDMLGYGTFCDILTQHKTCYPHRHRFEQHYLLYDVGLNYTKYAKSLLYTTPSLFIQNIYTISVDGIPDEILRKIMSYL